MKVARWGNSLAVRLPRETVEALGVREGDNLEFDYSPDGEVRLTRTRDFSEWVGDMRRKYRARLGEDFRFERGEASDRGD